MDRVPQPPQGQPSDWIVATDLDGTLLDHRTYDFEPARPALDLLRQRRIQLVVATSKTWSEVHELRARLETPGATVVENGSAIVLGPSDPAFSRLAELGGTTWSRFDDGIRRVLAPPRDRLLAVVHDLRDRHGFEFVGFADLSPREVAELCDFGAENAKRARDRWCSEPIFWRDTEAALYAFEQRLAAAGLTLRLGGRFHHVLGDVDKGRALDLLLEELEPQRRVRVLALGDGPNDRGLLATADIAVVVPNPHGKMPLEPEPGWIVAEDPGPRGWNRAVTSILSASREAQQ